MIPLPLLHLHEVCGACPAYPASRPNFRSREQYRGLLDPFGRLDEGGHGAAGDGLQVGELEGHSLELDLCALSLPIRARYVVRRKREFRTSMEYIFSGPACCLLKVSSSEIEIFEHKVGCKSFSTDPHHGRDCLLLTPPHECGPLPLLAGQRPGSRDGRGWLPHFPQSLEGTSRLLQAEAAWSVFSRGCHLKRMRY